MLGATALGSHGQTQMFTTGLIDQGELWKFWGIAIDDTSRAKGGLSGDHIRKREFLMSERDFQKDQIEHLQLIQKQVLNFCNKMLRSAIEHDTSKWSNLEYDTFCKSRESLRGSKTGQDDDYQKNFKSDAIQHHVKNNPHHPEYWDDRGQAMPVYEIISMFFDWRSRCIAKGSSINDFWDYNIAKLKNQSHAIPIVSALRLEYGNASALEEGELFVIRQRLK